MNRVFVTGSDFEELFSGNCVRYMLSPEVLICPDHESVADVLISKLPAKSLFMNDASREKIIRHGLGSDLLSLMDGDLFIERLEERIQLRKALYPDAARNILKSNGKCKTIVFLTNDESQARRLNDFKALENLADLYAGMFDLNNGRFYIFSENGDAAHDFSDDNPGAFRAFHYYGGMKSEIGSQKTIIPEDICLIKDSNQRSVFVSTEGGKRFYLREMIGRGGEGSVYTTDEAGIVAKIYKPASFTNIFEDKIRFMVDNQIGNDRIIWPIHALYDGKGIFTGYAMRFVPGENLHDVVMSRDRESPSCILSMDRRQILGIIISVLENIVYLHKRNILLGDVKLDNIVISEKNGFRAACMVDCDSFQIDRFPAPKLTAEYAPPELSKHMKSLDYFRTFENEYYSLFVLLFRILHKGVLPYSQQNAPDWVDKSYEGIFPYSLNRIETEKRAPRGYPPVNWSHLPSYIKKAFIYVGKHDPGYFENRISADEWLELFRAYAEDLSGGRLDKDDRSAVGVHDIHDEPIDYSLVDLEFERRS